MQLLAQVNRDLLLLLKTNDCLLHLEHQLDAPLSVYASLARHAAQASANSRAEAGAGNSSSVFSLGQWRLYLFTRGYSAYAAVASMFTPK